MITVRDAGDNAAIPAGGNTTSGAVATGDGSPAAAALTRTSP